MPVAAVLGALAPFSAIASQMPPDALAKAIRNAQPTANPRPSRYRGSKYETPAGKRFGDEEKRQ